MSESRQRWVEGATKTCINCYGGHVQTGTLCEVCVVIRLGYDLDIMRHSPNYPCNVCKRPSVYINPGNLEPECGGCLSWRRDCGLLLMPPHHVEPKPEAPRPGSSAGPGPYRSNPRTISRSEPETPAWVSALIFLAITLMALMAKGLIELFR